MDSIPNSLVVELDNIQRVGIMQVILVLMVVLSIVIVIGAMKK